MTGKNEKPVLNADEGQSPTELIDTKIATLGDWRGETLARMRKLIRQADPDVVEAVKWRKPTNPAGVPVWEHAGIICTGETYKGYVKLTFAKGAFLSDPTGLFNGSLNGTRCARSTSARTTTLTTRRSSRWSLPLSSSTTP